MLWDEHEEAEIRTQFGEKNYLIHPQVECMQIPYKVETVYLNESDSGYQIRELEDFATQINRGDHFEDGWMLVSVTPVTASYGDSSYTSHLILLFKRL